MHRVNGVSGNEAERYPSGGEGFALSLEAPVHFPRQDTCRDTCQDTSHDSDRVSAAARFGGSHLSCHPAAPARDAGDPSQQKNNRNVKMSL